MLEKESAPILFRLAGAVGLSAGIMPTWSIPASGFKQLATVALALTSCAGAFVFIWL
jgi:hypothetical protein